MPVLHLTKSAIEKIQPPATGQIFYRDATLPGFGLRVGTKGRAYFAEGQVRRRTIRVTIGRHDVFTPEVARRRALKILAEMADGRNPNEERRAKRAAAMSVQQSFDSFFERRPLAPTSHLNYGRTIDVYLKDWANKSISEITRRMVLERHQRIAEQHGPVTANNIFRHFRAVHNFVSASHGELPPNPVTILGQARAWNPERRRRSVVPMHGLPKWWRAVQQEDDLVRDFLLTGLFTGLRRSEIAHLRWENIDLEGRTLTVPTTKNGDLLQLPLSQFLYELFVTRRDNNPEDEWVFAGRGKSGHVVEPKTFHRRVGERCGIKFTIHDLRRTFASVADSLDLSHFALKRLLNHRTDSDITGGYVVHSIERLRDPVERIAERILELALGPQTHTRDLREAA
jgi:integrase